NRVEERGVDRRCQLDLASPADLEAPDGHRQHLLAVALGHDVAREGGDVPVDTEGGRGASEVEGPGALSPPPLGPTLREERSQLGERERPTPLWEPELRPDLFALGESRLGAGIDPDRERNSGDSGAVEPAGDACCEEGGAVQG